MAARRPYLLIAIPLVLAACGGSGGSSSSSGTTTVSTAPIDAAVTKTLAQSGEKVALSGTVDLSGQAFSISGTGAFGQNEGELHLGLTVPLLGNSTLDLLEKGGSAWIQSPLLSSTLNGKKWLGVDLAKAPPKLFGLDLSPLLVADSPASLLNQLNAGTNPVEVGTETVGGVSTTHYRVDVGKASAADLQRTEDAWVDGQNIVRKLSYSVPIASGTKANPAVLTMTLSDFGTAVSVTVPPASEVAPASAVAK
jgi:hypothetical protein